MSTSARERLFGVQHAFDHPVTLATVVAIVVLLTVAPGIILLLAKLGWVSAKLRKEMMVRYLSWLVLTVLILGPILLGAAWTIVGIGILSLFSYREYARVTGLFREKTVSLVVVVGIVAVTFATLDHWYRLFVALVPFTACVIAVAAILGDRPRGYIQRVGLGVLGFVLLGSCLGHLGYLANDSDYRPKLILIFLSVELNDVFAFIVGKTLGKRKLSPNTSPNKTLAGSVGALILTTLLMVGVGSFVFEFEDSAAAKWIHLTALGLLVSILGQFGDLMLSSIKRDVGVKDMAATIPGHGGLLDRFDSIILVSPAVFHYLNYFVGVGTEQSQHLITGG